MPGGLLNLKKGYPEEEILKEPSQPVNGIPHIFPLGAPRFRKDIKL